MFVYGLNGKISLDLFAVWPSITMMTKLRTPKYFLDD